MLFGSDGQSKRGSVIGIPSEAGAHGHAWPQSHGEVAAIVDAFADRLVRFAFRKLGNRQDAEDAVQDVFVRSFATCCATDRSHHPAVLAVGPYLYRSVANACTDAVRRRNSATSRREEVRVEEILTGADGPAEIVEAAEGLRRAESLLSRLPPEQAEAIRLRVFDGLRLSEIADVMECPVDTVCSRLRYGFQKLRSLAARKEG